MGPSDRILMFNRTTDSQVSCYISDMVAERNRTVSGREFQRLSGVGVGCESIGKSDSHPGRANQPSERHMKAGEGQY